MDVRTERLQRHLDELALKVATVQSLIRSGHDLEPVEVLEWSNAVGNHLVVYNSMVMLLTNPEVTH